MPVTKFPPCPARARAKTRLFHDSVLVEGGWLSPEHKRLKVIRSKIVSTFATNDDECNPVKLSRLKYSRILLSFYTLSSHTAF